MKKQTRWRSIMRRVIMKCKNERQSIGLLQLKEYLPFWPIVTVIVSAIIQTLYYFYNIMFYEQFGISYEYFYQENLIPMQIFWITISVSLIALGYIFTDFTWGDYIKLRLSSFKKNNSGGKEEFPKALCKAFLRLCIIYCIIFIPVGIIIFLRQLIKKPVSDIICDILQSINIYTILIIIIIIIMFTISFWGYIFKSKPESKPELDSKSRCEYLISLILVFLIPKNFHIYLFYIFWGIYILIAAAVFGFLSITESFYKTSSKDNIKGIAWTLSVIILILPPIEGFRNAINKKDFKVIVNNNEWSFDMSPLSEPSEVVLLETKDYYFIAPCKLDGKVLFINTDIHRQIKKEDVIVKKVPVDKWESK